MTETTLERGGAIQEKEWSASHWLKRLLAVACCLCLLLTLCVAFTRVIAARVPEQRATLEKLIADRTGLDVRFENVRFAWNLEGTSAVFTRVQLTDGAAGRVRVVAPELRVQLDTWDLLRHQQFSLGHVTLASPDIEIIADVAAARPAPATRGTKPRDRQAPVAIRDESTLLRNYLSWAEAMPAGRIEVEGARVHLKRRGEAAAGQNFTLSQAVISRGSSTFNAYGTMLLPQDVGQSLYVSARLDGLESGARVSGDLRLIARRVFLERLPVDGLSGRGTLDAKLQLRDGAIASGSWQASARELQVGGEAGQHFDHVSVVGHLSRDARDLVLDLTDLQLTRGARLDRAPAVSARLSIDPSSLRVTRTTLQSDRLPFLAAQLVTGFLVTERPGTGGWSPTSGELRDLEYDSGDGNAGVGDWRVSAQVADVELWRATDQSQLRNLAGTVRADAQGLTFSFDPASAVELNLAQAGEPRTLSLGGELRLTAPAARPAWMFDSFTARVGAGELVMNGGWVPDRAPEGGLRLSLARVDRALMLDAWKLLGTTAPLPDSLSDLRQGSIVAGTLSLAPAADGSIDWPRSSGNLRLADLATAGETAPGLAGGRGVLNFSRGAAQLKLEDGIVGQLALNTAQVDWPRHGPPRLHVALTGTLDAPLVRDALRSQGFDRLGGAVTLEAEARGEREVRQPDLWRVTARVSGAKVLLGAGLPPADNLAGTIRYTAGQLRGLELRGDWLGGAVEIESRRAASRTASSFNLRGTADAQALLKLLGHEDAAPRVAGQLSWNGTAEAVDQGGGWQVNLSSNLAGVESRLPEPFDKPRARAWPVTAQLHVAAGGIGDFEVQGTDLSIHGQVRNDVVRARFSLRGIEGDFQRAAQGAENPQVRIDGLDLRHAPALLAAVGALLPSGNGMVLTVDGLRYGDSKLGVLHAALDRRASSLAFSVDSGAEAIHQLSAHGHCDAERHCTADFTADTTQLAALLRDARLPPEWPLDSLHARGALAWPADSGTDFAKALSGTFDLETAGDRDQQLTARGSIADGEILLADVQGTGPAPDQVFRGNGRVGMLARNYDLTVDYERVTLAAAAMPSPARARLSRAWNAVRGAAPETKRVQWHGTWD